MQKLLNLLREYSEPEIEDPVKRMNIAVKLVTVG